MNRWTNHLIKQRICPHHEHHYHLCWDMRLILKPCQLFLLPHTLLRTHAGEKECSFAFRKCCKIQGHLPRRLRQVSTPFPTTAPEPWHCIRGPWSCAPSFWWSLALRPLESCGPEASLTFRARSQPAHPTAHASERCWAGTAQSFHSGHLCNVLKVTVSFLLTEQNGSEPCPLISPPIPKGG